MRAGDNTVLTQTWAYRVLIVVGAVFLLAGCALGRGGVLHSR